MLLIVFSDNHRDRISVEWIKNENPNADRIISLGDSEMKEHELSSMGIIGVKGNYPFEPDFPYELVFEFDDWRFWFTHGHKFFVKSGLRTLLESAQSRRCDVVVFGHTHQAHVTREEGIIFINPGSSSLPRSTRPKTYAVIHTQLASLSVELREVFTNKLIEKNIFPKLKKEDDYGF